MENKMDLNELRKLAGMDYDASGGDTRVAKEDALLPKSKPFGVDDESDDFDSVDAGMDVGTEEDEFELELAKQLAGNAKPEPDFGKQYDDKYWPSERELGEASPEAVDNGSDEQGAGDGGLEMSDDSHASEHGQPARYDGFAAHFGEVDESSEEDEIIDDLDVALDDELDDAELPQAKVRAPSEEPDYEQEYEKKYWPSERELGEGAYTSPTVDQIGGGSQQFTRDLERLVGLLKDKGITDKERAGQFITRIVKQQGIQAFDGVHQDEVLRAAMAKLGVKEGIDDEDEMDFDFDAPDVDAPAKVRGASDEPDWEKKYNDWYYSNSNKDFAESIEEDGTLEFDTSPLRDMNKFDWKQRATQANQEADDPESDEMISDNDYFDDYDQSDWDDFSDVDTQDWAFDESAEPQSAVDALKTQLQNGDISYEQFLGELDKLDPIDNSSLKLNMDDVPTAAKGEYNDYGIEEDSLNNGYGDEAEYDAAATFPKGDHGPISRTKGRLSNGDNPLANRLAVSESQIKKELWESLHNFKKKVAEARPRKTEDEYTLQGNYGYGDGWEDLTSESDRKQIIQRKKEYLENDPRCDYRIVKRRVKIGEASKSDPLETHVLNNVGAQIGDQYFTPITLGLNWYTGEYDIVSAWGTEEGTDNTVDIFDHLSNEQWNKITNALHAKLKTDGDDQREDRAAPY